MSKVGWEMQGIWLADLPIFQKHCIGQDGGSLPQSEPHQVCKAMLSMSLRSEEEGKTFVSVAEIRYRRANGFFFLCNKQFSYRILILKRELILLDAVVLCTHCHDNAR